MTIVFSTYEIFISSFIFCCNKIFIRLFYFSSNKNFLIFFPKLKIFFLSLSFFVVIYILHINSNFLIVIFKVLYFLTTVTLHFNQLHYICFKLEHFCRVYKKIVIFDVLLLHDLLLFCTKYQV